MMMAGGQEEKTLVQTRDSDSLSHFLLSFERLSVRKRAAPSFISPNVNLIPFPEVKFLSLSDK